MKMLKKLLAVVLTGAMALTLLTACGSNAVTEKDLADALTDMAKAEGKNITLTPRAEERELARKIAALHEGKTTDQENGDEIKEILECKEGGANANNFVWWGEARADKIGTSGQAYQLAHQALKEEDAENYHNLQNEKPVDDRYMGTALCKMIDEDGKTVTVRVIVVTAPVKGQEPQRPGKA